MTRLRDLKWGEYPGLSGWLNVMTTALTSGRQEGQNQRRTWGSRSSSQGASLGVQWLRLHAPSAGGRCLREADDIIQGVELRKFCLEYRSRSVLRK